MRARCHNHVIHWALRPRKINPVALHVLLILACHAREDGALEADLPHVSKLTRQPEKLVKEALEYLQRAKLITTAKLEAKTLPTITLRVNR